MNRFSVVELAISLSNLHALACRCAKEQVRRAKGAEADDVLLEKIGNVLNGVSQFANAENTPQSITFGVTPTAATADPVEDVKALVADYSSSGGRLESAAFVLSSANAIGLRLTGHEAFRQLERNGGAMAGVPAVASDAVGDVVILVDTARTLLADDGEARIDTTEHGSIIMSDDPTIGDPAIHLWSQNLTGIRAERFTNWEALPGAVAVLTGASYLEPAEGGGEGD